MALQVSFSDPTTRVVLPSAYVRILSITIDAVAQTIDVAIGIYATAAARAAGGTPVVSYHAWPPFAAITNGPVDIQAASYNFVKGLSVFSGAADVA